MHGESSQLCKNISIIKFYTSRKNLERRYGFTNKRNEKQINKQPKIKQTNIRPHCFITSICVSTDLLKVANSIIIFSLTNLIWGLRTTHSPRLSPDSRSRKERPDGTGRWGGGSGVVGKYSSPVNIGHCFVFMI